jgi:hypothetical protein
MQRSIERNNYSTQTFVAHDALDDDARALIVQFVTPRVALDGSFVYLLDEVDLDALDELRRARRAAGEDSDPPPSAPPSPARPGDAASPQSSNDLRDVYRARAAAAADPIARATALRQLAALERAASGRSAEPAARPARWAHVPIAALFEAAGNRVLRRSNGLLECGHEPVHASRSGRCLIIDPASGRWYCRSCRRGGDAIDALRSLRGWDYRQAADWLTARYGPPAGDQQPARRRRRPAWREVRL